jgi:methyltransferase
MDSGLWVYILLAFLVFERGVELLIAHANEAWLLSRGGREYDAQFSRFMVIFHTIWFLSFAVEAYTRSAAPLVSPAWVVLAAIALQTGRYWCIASLGRCWNTKVIVLPGAALINHGPYRSLKHPNYLVVVIEILLYPALFGCWWTAAFFGLGNVWVLKRRIQAEERALAGN